MDMKKSKNQTGWLWYLGTVVLCLLGTAATVSVLLFLLMGTGTSGSRTGTGASPEILDKFDMHINHVTSSALEGVLQVEKVYWLQDADLVAPEPDPDRFGETEDPSTLGWLLEEARDLLEGEELIFHTGVKIPRGSKVKYYLDDTILAVTWKEAVGHVVYTYSEVKIADPSQFRRFLSDGTYGSGTLYTTTEMAASVNAVTASSGDYYSYRNFGNLIYNGQVKRAGTSYLDTCFVDQNGDLLLMDYFQIYRQEELENYVRENEIRFSLAFGPILVRDGKNVVKVEYPIGEVEQEYSRSALCQIGPLHYMLAVVNRRGEEIWKFSHHLWKMGVRQAYALDGGQTATIVTGDERMNTVDYGEERRISDILYFATAIPNGG